MKFIRDIIKEKTQATPVEGASEPFVLGQEHLPSSQCVDQPQVPSEHERASSVQEGLEIVQSTKLDDGSPVVSEPESSVNLQVSQTEDVSVSVPSKREDPTALVADMMARDAQSAVEVEGDTHGETPKPTSPPVFNIAIKKPSQEPPSSNEMAANEVGDVPLHNDELDASINLFADVTPTPAGAVSANASGSSPAGERRTGRVRTRLLGFGGAQHAPADPITQVKEDAQTPAQFAVGWLVITAGPGRGKAFTLLDGVSNIGRGADQEVRLDFGDNSISRESHAVIAYDRMSRSFYLGHGGKANLVRLRDTPVLSTEKINDSDTIKIGETELRLVALCGEDFDWESDTSSNDTDLSFG